MNPSGKANHKAEAENWPSGKIEDVKKTEEEEEENMPGK